MQMSSTPVVKDLVLVGGGHAHVSVLRRLGMRPVPGLRATLVARDLHTPYSGMLPGYVAGHYDYDACHIDLRPLAQFAGARFYHTEVEGLDLGERALHVAERPAVAFDLLSINTGVRARFRRVLGERGVEVLTDHRVSEVTPEALLAEGQAPVAVDAALWVTTASAPAWPGEAGLAVTDEGFIRVDVHLQSVSHPGVFAAGDVAALPDQRPKSGVFAVRQGPVLANNLQRAATGQGLVRYQPQRRFLGLISTGDRYAVASRGGWSLEGAWLWRAKDWIDRRFMQRFNDLPAGPAAPALAAGIADQEAIRELSTVDYCIGQVRGAAI